MAGARESVLPAPVNSQREARWDLAFVGILAYLLVEYGRLPHVFPILRPLNVGKVAALIALIGLLFAARYRGNIAREVRLMDASLLLVLVGALISAVFAADLEVAGETYLDLLRWVIVYFLIARIVNNAWRLKVFMFFFLLLNFRLAQFQIRNYYFEREMGVSEDVLAKGVGTWNTGFFSNSNDFGLAMCVVLPLAAFVALGQSRRWMRWLMLAFSLSFLVALLLSGSRGAFASVVVVGAVAMLKSSRRLVGVGLLLLLLLVGITILPAANWQRIDSALHWERDVEANIRVTLWKAGLGMLHDHPLLGVGPGNFGVAYQNYYHYDVYDSNPGKWAPHSIYVHAFSELGLTGGFPMLAFWIAVILLNRRTCLHLAQARARGERLFEYHLAAGLNLAMLAFLVGGAFLTVLYYPHLWFISGLSVGVHLSAVRQPAAAPMADRLQPQLRTLPVTASPRLAILLPSAGSR